MDSYLFSGMFEKDSQQLFSRQMSELEWQMEMMQTAAIKRKPTFEESMQNFIQASYIHLKNEEISFHNIHSKIDNVVEIISRIEDKLELMKETSWRWSQEKRAKEIAQTEASLTWKGGKVTYDKIDGVSNDSNVFAGHEKEVNARRAIFPIINPPTNYTPPPPYVPPVPFPGRLMQHNFIETSSNCNEEILALDFIPPEIANELSEEYDEGSEKEEIEHEYKLKKLPHSLRYASIGNELCFLLIDSSSFSGVEEDTLMQFKDHAVKVDMELSMESKNGSDMKRVDGIMDEFAREPIDNIEIDESEDTLLFNNVLGALLFSKPLPSFKEPEHRKAKFRDMIKT